MRWWPFGRSAAEPPQSAPAVAGASVRAPSAAGWQDVPRLQRTLAAPLAPVAINDHFRDSLATSADPSFLAPLTHGVEPLTGGLADGLVVAGRPVTHGGPELVVPARSEPKATPRVQRLASWSEPEVATVPLEYPESVPASPVVVPEPLPADPAAAAVDAPIVEVVPAARHRPAAPSAPPAPSLQWDVRAAATAQAVPAVPTLGPRLLATPLTAVPEPISPRVAASTQPAVQRVSYETSAPTPRAEAVRSSSSPSPTDRPPTAPEVVPVVSAAERLQGSELEVVPPVRELPTVGVARSAVTTELPTLASTPVPTPVVGPASVPLVQRQPRERPTVSEPPWAGSRAVVESPSVPGPTTVRPVQRLDGERPIHVSRSAGSSASVNEPTSAGAAAVEVPVAGRPEEAAESPPDRRDEPEDSQPEDTGPQDTRPEDNGPEDFAPAIARSEPLVSRLIDSERPVAPDDEGLGYTEVPLVVSGYPQAVAPVRPTNEASPTTPALQRASESASALAEAPFVPAVPLEAWSAPPAAGSRTAAPHRAVASPAAATPLSGPGTSSRPALLAPIAAVQRRVARPSASPDSVDNRPAPAPAPSDQRPTAYAADQPPAVAIGPAVSLQRESAPIVQPPLVVSGRHAPGAEAQRGPVGGVSFASMFAGVGGFGSGSSPEGDEGEADAVAVQRESSPAPAADTGTESAAEVSPAAAPAAGAAPPTSAAHLDEMARRLYEPLAARLREELWLDRERAGVMSDG